MKEKDNHEQTVLTHKHNLDQCAELGWNEIKTTKYILANINESPLIKGFGDTKVGALYKLGKGTRAIFLRADIDALPTLGAPKHICGHSTHTAALLGAYHYLQSRESDLTMHDKSVYFVFQPAEETFPSGAAAIVKDHAKLIEQCEYGFGLHVAPELSAGCIGLQSGVINAAGDYIEIEVKGKSIHVKSTPKGIDAIEAAAMIVQKVRSFQKSFPQFGKEVVFNLNTIKGGTAANRVADHVIMTGDIRWQHAEDAQQIKIFFNNLAQSLKEHTNATVIVSYYDGYPPLYNTPDLTDMIATYLKPTFTIQRMDIETLGTEDYSFLSARTKSLYAKIGIGGKIDLHDDLFDVPDDGVLLSYKYWQHVLDWWIGF